MSYYVFCYAIASIFLTHWCFLLYLFRHSLKLWENIKLMIKPTKFMYFHLTVFHIYHFLVEKVQNHFWPVIFYKIRGRIWSGRWCVFFCHAHDIQITMRPTTCCSKTRRAGHSVLLRPNRWRWRAINIQSIPQSQSSMTCRQTGIRRRVGGQSISASRRGLRIITRLWLRITVKCVLQLALEEILQKFSKTQASRWQGLRRRGSSDQTMHARPTRNCTIGRHTMKNPGLL